MVLLLQGHAFGADLHRVSSGVAARCPGCIVLVLDRLPAHVAAATRRWLAERQDRIVVHFLPAYAPEMNPDEHVWSQLKGLFRRTPVLATEDFDAVVENAMIGIALDRSLVRRFFDHPDVAYVEAALHW